MRVTAGVTVTVTGEDRFTRLSTNRCSATTSTTAPLRRSNREVLPAGNGSRCGKGVSDKERMELLSDPVALARLHALVWNEGHEGWRRSGR